MAKIRVLVVDDSVVVRRVVMDELAAQPDLEVAGWACDGREALVKAAELHPDLIILNIEMPEMDGLTALAELRKRDSKTPVIMFSSHTEMGAAATFDALSVGASAFFTKPSGAGGLLASRRLIREELVPSIRALTARERTPVAPSIVRPPAALARVDVLAIGASTGGPNALVDLFTMLPPDLPVPIVVVQHMPPMFTRLFAERLAKKGRIPAKEAQHDDALEPGKALIAPGDNHLVLAREGLTMRAKLNQEPRENACRPSVDPLLRSAANIYGRNCLALILTGMGTDGLRGCEAIRAVGGQIVVQDEATSVVWGMPGCVARAGLADKVLPLTMIAGEIVRRVRNGRG